MRWTLDLYFTNNPTLARQVKMIPGIGDHHSAIMVDSLIKPMVNKLQSRKVYQYHKGDWDSIKAGLTSFAPKFRSDCQKMNIDEMWNSFHSKMMSLRETYIPSKTVKTQRSLPWINHVLRRLTGCMLNGRPIARGECISSRASGTPVTTSPAGE